MKKRFERVILEVFVDKWGNVQGREAWGAVAGQAQPERIHYRTYTANVDKGTPYTVNTYNPPSSDEENE